MSRFSRLPGWSVLGVLLTQTIHCPSGESDAVVNERPSWLMMRLSLPFTKLIRHTSLLRSLFMRVQRNSSSLIGIGFRPMQ